MKNKLQNFDLLCQQIQNSIIIQKKHGFLHKLRPFSRNKAYLEQDFLNLWEESCLAKFKYALQSANLDKIRYKEVQVPNGQRDVYVGTDRPGVILRYKINPKDQKQLIIQILDRLKNNSVSDDLASWRGYIENDISYCEKNNIEFHLPMQFQIIARVIPKENQSFQNDKNQQIHEYNHGGFTGNFYLWFDFKKYKEELKDIINKQKASQNITTQQTENASDNQQDENIHLTSPIQDKILLGTISIKIIEKDDSAFVKVMNNLFSKGAEELLYTGISNTLDKLSGNGKYADTTEKPDRIKRHSTLFGYEKPYIKVISLVTLKDWLYNIVEQPERKYLGQDANKINTSSLTKFPFVKEYIKKSGDPTLTDNIDQNICWSVGNLSGNEKWNRIPITKKWLQNTQENVDHSISLRFQSWVKKDGKYYFEYRFVFNLNNFYKLKDEITRLNIEIHEAKNNPKAITKNRLEKIQKEYNEKKIYVSSFDLWFQNYINEMSKYRPNETIKASADKLLYDSKDQLVGKDIHIGSSLQQLNNRDIAAYNFLTKNILGNIKNWKCQGESFNQILSNLYIQDNIQQDQQNIQQNQQNQQNN